MTVPIDPVEKAYESLLKFKEGLDFDERMADSQSSLGGGNCSCNHSSSGTSTIQNIQQNMQEKDQEQE